MLKTERKNAQYSSANLKVNCYTYLLLELKKNALQVTIKMSQKIMKLAL